MPLRFWKPSTSLYMWQILLLSGVGDAEHLKSKDIPVVVDLPGVGQNLTDHPVVDMYYKTKSDARSIRFLRPESLKDRFKYMLALIQYLILGTGGPMAMNVRLFHFDISFPDWFLPKVWRSCGFRAHRRSGIVPWITISWKTLGYNLCQR